MYFVCECCMWLIKTVQNLFRWKDPDFKWICASCMFILCHFCSPLLYFPVPLLALHSFLADQCALCHLVVHRLGHAFKRRKKSALSVSNAHLGAHERLFPHKSEWADLLKHSKIISHVCFDLLNRIRYRFGHFYEPCHMSYLNQPILRFRA